MKNGALGKFGISTGILALVGLWVFTAKQPFHPLMYVLIGSMILIAGFQIYFGLKAYKNESAGLNPEDELSKRIQEKAAAKAFKISVFMWLFVELFLFDILHIDTAVQAKIAIGLGMLGMGLIFLFTWFYLSKVGISDDNKD